MNIHSAIRNLHPSAEFALNGDEYSGLEWLSKDIAKPTESELKSSWKSGQVSRGALVEIERLEALQTMRRMSEAMPDDAGGSAGGRAWMKSNRDAIVVERSKL